MALVLVLAVQFIFDLHYCTLIIPPILLFLFFGVRFVGIKSIFFCIFLMLLLVFAALQFKKNKLSADSSNSYSLSESNEYKVYALELSFKGYQSILLHSSGAKVYANLPLFPRVSVGDTLLVKCSKFEQTKLESFDLGSSFDKYLFVNSVDAKCSFAMPTYVLKSGDDYFFKSRKYTVEVLGQILPEPFSSLCLAVTFGVPSYLSDVTKNELNKLGLAFIFTIDGSHIALVSLFLTSIFRKKSFAVSFITLALLFVYIGISGFKLPAVRAVSFFALSFFSSLLGYKASADRSLLVVTAVFLFLNPLLALDVGFLLTVSIVNSITTFSKWCNFAKDSKASNFFKSKLKNELVSTYAYSLLIFISASAISVYAFGSLNFGLITLAPLISLALIPQIALLTIASILSFGIPILSTLTSSLLYFFCKIIIDLGTYF